MLAENQGEGSIMTTELKNSFSVELTDVEVEYIKATWDCQTDAEVRRIVQSFVNQRLPVDVEQTIKRLRAPYGSSKRR